MASKSFKMAGDPVVDYVTEHSIRLHPVHEKLMEETKRLRDGDAMMMGDPVVLQLNQLLMRSVQAKKVLDIGVFTGCSALAAALALPDDGLVVACDVSEEFTSVGRKYWEEAGVAHKIRLELRPALETLQRLLDDGQAGTFDFAFIDADKDNYVAYYEMALQLLRRGGLVAVDNVLWSGRVVDESNRGRATEAIRRFNRHLAADQRVDISVLAVADGLSLALKK